MKRIILALAGFALASSLFGADYINVNVILNVPKAWEASVKDAIEVKLNAIPDVQVVKSPDEAMFTIMVDINAVENKSDEVLGYSLAAVIYGSYDQKVLKGFFDEVGKTTQTESDRAWLPFLQYAISGNVFLAGFIHTHGSVNTIDTAYDEIVARLKSTALPAYRKMLTMLQAAMKEGAPKPLSVRRQ